jgi:hypothetical protein
MKLTRVRMSPLQKLNDTLQCAREPHQPCDREPPWDREPHVQTARSSMHIICAWCMCCFRIRASRGAEHDQAPYPELN